jgi:hypothetical protein
LILLLIKQQLSIVVVHVALVAKVLNAASEGRHTTGYRTHLVLCHAELDVGEDEVLVEIDRFLVVGGCEAEFGEDKVELCTVVVDVGIVRVVLRGDFEVLSGGFTVACDCQYDQFLM